MPSWFTLDGGNCEDVGIHVLEYPPFVLAERRRKEFTVPGGNTQYVFDGAWGYEDVTLPIRCTVDEDADMTAVIEFLLPDYRHIIFGNDPGYVRTGVLTNQVDIEKVLRERKKRNFTAEYRCSPFKHLAVQPADIVITASSAVLSHPGTARAYPVIKVEGSGSGKITLHAVDEFAVTGLVSGEPLIIDSGAMICTDADGLEDLSYKTAGDYPWLDPGDNLIQLSGGITRVTVTPNWAWL